ncbi:MAG: CinA family nicotinamide mononucleotide deamidase-related protein, partial [Elusimicrobia bacterium]|nr:CinA family nicotinamide mononucleotide deamidase-related protein [Elusimicrobiota bacterium]
MRIELICFGSELLKDKVNSNVCHIAERLERIGLTLDRVVTVGDARREVKFALRDSLRRAQILITSGGLGPTFDDLSCESVAQVLGRPLQFSPTVMRAIVNRFRSAGLEMPEENKKQAFLIRGSQVIVNRVGTAPGQIVKDRGRTLILLPGPPKELIPMMEDSVIPYLKRFSQSSILSLTLHIFGFTESDVDERIKPVVEKKWDQKDISVTFGILAHHSIIDVKVKVQGKSPQKCGQVLLSIKKELHGILGQDVYGENEETLESVVGKILKKRKETLSIAESCTGGLIADKVTDVPGSSQYFLEGLVTYSDESKVNLLGVRRETLKRYGAVSEPVAKEMAHGILKRSQSDWSISCTGIA